MVSVTPCFPKLLCNKQLSIMSDNICESPLCDVCLGAGCDIRRHYDGADEYDTFDLFTHREFDPADRRVRVKIGCVRKLFKARGAIKQELRVQRWHAYARGLTQVFNPFGYNWNSTNN